MLRYIKMIQYNAALLVFPAKAGTHVGHGHRSSPVWQDFVVSLIPLLLSEPSEWV